MTIRLDVSFRVLAAGSEIQTAFVLRRDRRRHRGIVR